MSNSQFPPIEVVPKREAPTCSPNQQDNLAGRYPRWVGVFAMSAFTLAFAGWLNETWFFLWDSPIWLNRYTEYAIILGFGIWRIVAEKNPYTKRRLMILVTVVTILWWLIPWLSPVFEPYTGYQWNQPVFPSLHAPGTLTFFLVLSLVLMFGRRIICSYGCPCVGIRETVGFPFRFKTIRGGWTDYLRHTKWFFFVAYVGVLVVTLFPPTGWTTTFVGFFGLAVALTYFGSFYLIPITGNRFYCRSMCPFGATFGVLNHAGFYDVRMDPERCIDCARCEQACDMGIPVMREGKQYGYVKRIEDCMGCGRCIVSCPTDALEIRDVRNLFRPKLRQDASHLLKIDNLLDIPAQKRTGENEILSLDQIVEQASRCIDCGEPTCRQGCPLRNRIPEWLALARNGDINQAADLIHSTNPLPEFCGQLCPQERLCEGACARERQGLGAVAIGAVEHSVVQIALQSGWKPDLAADRNGLKAATIGSGPASIAFAERLNRQGWSISVYERDSRMGGMLSSGLPEFRFDKNALKRRQQLLTDAGIEFRFNTEVDETGFNQILKQYDAVFLGIGARQSKTIDIPGHELPGVINAIDFLADFNKRFSEPRLTGLNVEVIGGGDSAMDCARAAKRWGASSVTLAYRGSSEKMRASEEERELTRADQVTMAFDYRPLRIEGDKHVNSIAFETIEGEKSIACDRVILAIGQQGSSPEWLTQYGVELQQGQVVTRDSGETGHPQIYAGGDSVHGPDLISTAIAAGRRAADTVFANYPRSPNKQSAIAKGNSDFAKPAAVSST